MIDRTEGCLFAQWIYEEEDPWKRWTPEEREIVSRYFFEKITDVQNQLSHMWYGTWTLRKSQLTGETHAVFTAEKTWWRESSLHGESPGELIRVIEDYWT